MIATYALDGHLAHPVTAACDLSRRLPAVVLVGLSSASAREVVTRLRGALAAHRWEWPRQRVELSVDRAGSAPTAYDLPLAVALLVASGQISAEPLAGLALYGELSLSGEVRGVRGTVAAAQAAAAAGQVLVTGPGPGADLAARLGLPVAVLRSLGELREGAPARHAVEASVLPPDPFDFADIHGQDPSLLDQLVEAARTRAPLLLLGPPGCGKIMLAARLGGILPTLTRDEDLQVCARHDGVGLTFLEGGRRPFRAPHHTISTVGLVGRPGYADAPMRFGEIDLANEGVLLLDELLEFPRATLEALGHALAEPGRRVWLVVSASVEPGTRDEERLARQLRALQIKPEVIPLRRIPHSEVVDGSAWPTSASLRARVGAA